MAGPGLLRRLVGGELGSGLDTPVIEPATGGDRPDRHRHPGGRGPRGADGRGRAAGRAATPHTERSAILRRAADIWLAHAADIEWWGIRESGKIPPAMQFETHDATQEIYEAATLPSRAYGELLPSEQPRLSFAERVPVGVTGVIAPFNFPQILAIRSVAPALALGNAVVLKPDPGRVRWRRTGARLRRSRAARGAAARAAGRRGHR